MKNILLIFWLLTVFCWGCRKSDYIHEEFESPSLEIISISILSKNTCEIELKINLGKGASFEEAYLIYNDITDPNDIVKKQIVELNAEKEQVHKIQISVDNDNHDYRIKAILVSQKNEYTSKPQIVNFAQKMDENGISVDFYISSNDYLYFDEANSVALHVKRGGYFLILFNYLKKPENTKLEVKLNGIIPMETENMDWDVCRVYLPDDISPGEYTVHVYINDIEYIINNKIRVLIGTTTEINMSPGPFDGFIDIGYRNHCFNIENMVYYIKGFLEYEVWIYDIEKDTWTKKNSIPIPSINDGTWIFPNLLQNENRNYIIVKNNTISLWEYDRVNDTWHQLTDYPGMGRDNFTTFIIDGKLYMGGGTDDSSFPPAFYDFWEYDFLDSKWNRKENVPFGKPEMSYVNAMCSNSTNGYVMSQYNELWKYNPSDDTWEKTTPLEAGPTRRIYGNLLSKNENLYLVGGYGYNGGLDYYDTSLGDVWKFDVKTNTWTLINWYNDKWFYITWYPIPAFFYNNNIYMGWTSTYFEGKPFLIKYSF